MVEPAKAHEALEAAGWKVKTKGEGWRRVVDLGQGGQVPRVALQADLAVAEEVDHALPQGDPLGLATSAAADPAADAKFLRRVNDRFNPEDQTGLVVHLDPVLFHAVFDPMPQQAAFELLHTRDERLQAAPHHAILV